MKEKRLSQTNPYLRNRTKRMAGLIASVCSSSAIEGIAANTLIEVRLQRSPPQRSADAKFSSYSGNGEGREIYPPDIIQKSASSRISQPSFRHSPDEDITSIRLREII